MFWWSWLAVVAAILLPEGSYLFVAPLVIASIATLLASGWARRLPARSARPAVAAGVIALAAAWFPLELHLHDALGFWPHPLPTARAVVLLIALTPLTMAGAGEVRRAVVIGAVLALATSLVLVVV